LDFLDFDDLGTFRMGFFGRARMPSFDDVSIWHEEVEGVTERIRSRFSRVDLRAHAGRYLRGLISRIERKNGWQLAEELGEQTPTNLQHFIARSQWSADEVRDDLQRYVIEHLGEKDGILIVDETGFLKKGNKSVGVKRQYSGTAGRIENSQIGVFLAYCSPAGHALIDRALYLPKNWAEDESRRREAKVPELVTFSTKPQLAREMPHLPRHRSEPHRSLSRPVPRRTWLPPVSRPGANPTRLPDDR
jgi:SRSO17 transposase